MNLRVPEVQSSCSDLIKRLEAVVTLKVDLLPPFDIFAFFIGNHQDKAYLLNFTLCLAWVSAAWLSCVNSWMLFKERDTCFIKSEMFVAGKSTDRAWVPPPQGCSQDCRNAQPSNGSWCIGIKGEMSGTVCVTFTWDIYIYMSCL